MSAIFRRNISLIIFITFFSILISCPSIQTKDLVICNIVTNNLPDAAAIGTFADGKILFNIGNEDSLHLIKPDGTSDFINNTCKLMDSKGSCNYHLLNPNYVIITSKHTCKVIDLMGNIILKNFKYDKMSVSEKNDRFLIMKHKNNEFTEYNVNNIGRISKRISSLYFSNKRHKITEIFSLDNAWGIISTTKGDNSFFSIIEAQAKNKTLIVEELYDYDSTDTDTTKCITNNQINDIQYYCLYISSNDNTLKLLNISNLSLNNNSFNINTTDLTPDIGFDTDTYIHVIPNVGFLVEATAYLKTKYYIFNIFEINYFDQNNAFGELIVNNTYNNFLGSHIFTLPNKTIVRMIENHNSIKFVQNDLTSKIPKNNPYNNPHIKQVYPPNNESIAIGTDKLNITFLNPIDPTIATYISIYYINNTNNDESILRQKFLCTSPYCIISKDFYSLTIYLSNNTFNIPNASYYVEIDDKFIEYKYELIKIPGIKPRNWIIKTDGSYTKKVTTNSILGKLRLNSTGSDKFRNLSDAKKSVFFDNMTNELVRSIPIDYWRIKNVKYEDEIDMVSGATLTTFSFQIDPPKTHDINKNSSKEVLEDLNSLIRSQGFTSNLDINNYTGDIDKDYGFQKENDLLEEIELSLKNFIMDPRYLIIIIIFLILIILLYFYGRYKNKKGTNIIVFKVALIIIDLISDIRFILKNDLPELNLFIPSIIFLSFPFILNIFLAVIIFKFEMQISKNSEWFKHFIKPVAIVTVLSSGDIEILHIFDSNFGGFKIFSAKFSPKTLNLIFWGGALNIILENLPQLIIQIIYAISSSTYDIASLLTLIISILVFLVSVVECSYHLFMNNKNGNHVGIQSDCNDEKDIT